MPRKPRIEYAGAVYHVMSRGNRGCDIYENDDDRIIFLETLGQVCSRTGWVIHAYVLMSNHYHILLETPEANLVDGMRWLQSTYTQRYNRSHRERGHLFQGRYKSLLVAPESGYYFEVVSSYIHLNPARAGMFDLSKEKLNSYVWSSYPSYTRPSKRPEWLCVDTVLGFFNQPDNSKGRAHYRLYMNKRVTMISRSEDAYTSDANWNAIRQGWCVGNDVFRMSMIERVEQLLYGKHSDSHDGKEVQLHNEKKAIQLILESLNKLGLTKSDLRAQRKGSIEKKVLVWYIHNRTTVRNQWISEQLYCGHPSNISSFVAEVNSSKDKNMNKLKKKILK